MYVGFVKHAKFLNAKTKPQITFMQNSLVEFFSMDHSTTYQYGFIYIRQMAIHLRNAITTKKKVSACFFISKPVSFKSCGVFNWSCSS